MASVPDDIGTNSPVRLLARTEQRFAVVRQVGGQSRHDLQREIR